MERIEKLAELIELKIAEGEELGETLVSLTGSNSVSFEFPTEASFELAVFEEDGRVEYHTLGAAEMLELSKYYKIEVDNYDVYSGTEITVFYSFEKRA